MLLIVETYRGESFEDVTWERLVRQLRLKATPALPRCIRWGSHEDFVKELAEAGWLQIKNDTIS